MTDLYIDPLVGVFGIVSNQPTIQAARGISPLTGVLSAVKTSGSVTKFSLESAASDTGLLGLYGPAPSVSRNRGIRPLAGFALVASTPPSVKAIQRSRQGLSVSADTGGNSITIERTS